MANFNKVILMGNLTKDPEVRYVPSGTAVGDLTIAVNRKYKSSSGDEQEETCFVNITVWGRQAETCGEYLRKGRPILVEGRLKQDRWEKDGQKHSRLGVVAERVQFLGGGTQGSEFRDTSEQKQQQQTYSRPEPRPEPSPEPTPEPPPAEPGPEENVEDEDNLPF